MKRREHDQMRTSEKKYFQGLRQHDVLVRLTIQKKSLLNAFFITWSKRCHSFTNQGWMRIQ